MRSSVSTFFERFTETEIVVQETSTSECEMFVSARLPSWQTNVSKCLHLRANRQYPAKDRDTAVRDKRLCIRQYFAFCDLPL